MPSDNLTPTNTKLSLVVEQTFETQTGPLLLCRSETLSLFFSVAFAGQAKIVSNMIRISNREDADKLYTWLAERPTDDRAYELLVLCFRAAMRVIPQLESNNYTHNIHEMGQLPFWRSLLTLQLYLLERLPLYTEPLRRAEAALKKLTSDSYMAIFADAEFVVSAGFSDLDEDQLRNLCVYIADGSGVDQDLASWDVHQIENGVDILRAPLRKIPSDDWLSTWQEKSRHSYLSMKNWDFWIEWYDAAIEGKQLDMALMKEIALQGDIFWDAAPAIVNSQIEDIAAKYKLLSEARELRSESEWYKKRIREIRLRAHNYLPELLEDFHEIEGQSRFLEEQLDQAVDELDRYTVSKDRLLKIAQRIKACLKAIAAYLGLKADLFVTESVKSSGKWAGPIIIGSLTLPKVAEFAEKLLQFASAQ